ncbi:MAG: hypothetical protein WC716_01895 [Chitinophagaceae bacterium]
MNRNKHTVILVWGIILLCLNHTSFGQSKVTLKAAQRYEIDAKRVGVDPGSEDALPRSREFLRLDSSYYVGWYFEGQYKLNHAADYLGYKNAIIPLEKALYLLERDYAKALSTRTNDIQVYFPIYNYQLDYTRIGYCLRECYANTEQPEKVVALMRRVLRWKLQRDLYLDAYNYLAWTTHRYRFYTTSKYAFLKNSIDANEKLAMSYLDSSLRNIERNKKYNQGLYQPGYETADKMGVYHYKCILYSYAFNIDSAEKYYGIMRKNNGLPHNNYANFKSVCGDFREAEKEYQIASGTDNADKRLQEWAYYTSILQIGKGQAKQGIELSDGMIKGFGSTPGFGWYNIALSRALTYDGQVAAAEKAVEKAANFKELHIGTTLGQSHYDFSVQLLKLIQKEQHIAMQKFEHKDWWYSPKILGNMAAMTTDRFMQQYLIINQFAQNPERDRVIYKLFSTESTVSWDEIWYLLKDFSTAFFVKRFEQELKINKRKPVDKYFKLFLARLKTKQGNYKEAKTLLNEILQDQHTDAEFEKLFLARTFQAFAECADKEKDEAERNKWAYQLFKTYPQLIPFCGLKAPLKLRISGNDEAVLKAFRNCNFNFESGASAAPTAVISFIKKGSKQSIRYSLIDSKGKTIVPEQTFSYKVADKAGIELAYRICGVGGNEAKTEK